MLGRLKRPRNLLLLVAIVVLTVVALWPRPTPADLAPVETGALSITVDEEGRTRIRDRYTVGAPVAGRLSRIELEPGDPVIDGETVIARLYPTPLDARTRAESEAMVEAAEAARGRAEAERERAVATLRQAEAEFARARQLAAAEVLSAELLELRETDVETAAKSLRAAEFAVESARHELERARARLVAASSSAGDQPIEIHSPIDGVVLRRHLDSEGIVGAGQQLVELGDPLDLEIVADVLSTDAVKIEPGARAIVERWGGDRELEARVRRVEPSGFTKISALGVEEQRVNVVLDFVDPAEAWTALGDGYRVEVRIVVWETEAALLAPAGSLFRRGEAWAVFVAEEGRARLATIELGRRNGHFAIIEAGLNEGDRVVLHPSDTLVDGARIERRESEHSSSD